MKRAGFKEMAAGALIVALLGSIGFGFFYGGNAARTITFDSPATSSDTGWSWATEYFYGRAGGVLHIQYEVELRRGAFFMMVYQQKPGLPEAGTRWVKQSGSGTFDVALPESGIYRVSFDGSPQGHGYDLSYRVSWRVR